MKSGSTINRSRLTWVEVLVALAILGVLVAMALPAVTHAFAHGPGRPMLSNMRQLWWATQEMAADGETNGDKSLGWPGDTGGTFSHWSRTLVPDYVGTNDFCKLLSSAGKAVPPGRFPLEMSESAILVYAVSSNSPDSAVFLSSPNFTNTPVGVVALQKTAKPMGNKQFVVLRRGGDGAILIGHETGKTNLIGTYVPLVK
jgi:hypothetical protein